ncbi:telomerase Cajal body protein 1 homolog isoform X2 [Aricia agestis]|uniref:telomerase Cajal body protein 1 homolog isoform X2 n=1 Tax=Aricia agestis TaxID=91739 RepID=UPI001C20C451|nr:telomerase Cajal body protein 1 homolog isoform X2 [Aricia agestis]
MEDVNTLGHMEIDEHQTELNDNLLSAVNDETINSPQVDHTNGNTNSQSDVNEEYLPQYIPLFADKTLVELCNSSWSLSNKKASGELQPYLRGCKWSPDGTCCLSVVNNDGVHVQELPRDLYTANVSRERTIDILDSIIHIKESGLVYDFCWYPGMNSNVPESCCWLTTRQNAPVQMWDAFDGSLRCSYRGFNAVDEMEPALSVTFNLDGTRIIAGYKKALRTFDVERPGREFVEHKTNSPASCFATDRNLVAMGSWNTTITLYNINEMGTYKSIGKMHGHTGGVTHMKFTPDGLKLVSGARKDNKLLVWDIRYYRRPLNILSRVVDTNQRIYFDISPCGKYLVSGGTDGIVKVWDENAVSWKDGLDVADVDKDNVTFKFPLHTDCCNSISIHPLRPILATGSGQYHFVDHQAIFEDDIKTEPMENTCDVNAKDLNTKYSSSCENSLVFWWIGDVEDNT